MCALMIDRYRSLCSPLTARQLSLNSIHRILFFICIAALCFSIPRYFELELRLDDENQYYLAQTDLVHNQIYMIGYRIVGGLMFYSLLPYIVLFAMSSRVWYVLRAAAKARLKMAAQQNVSGCTDSEMILLCVMAKFLCSRLMPTALDVAEHAIGSENFLDSAEATLCVDISNLLVVVASGANFIIFYFFSTTFRQKFWRRNSTSLEFNGFNSPMSSHKLMPSPSLRTPNRCYYSSSVRLTVNKGGEDEIKSMKRTASSSGPRKINQQPPVKCICYNI
uniref:G-protein coupled receptors family 1 profile domain-containing protein n=1 Tax=Panagrolaimus sp. ES5 TaxID=591445 RepID=A0AC34F9G8_9BILA